MERAELILPNTRNRLMYTYNKFLAMKEKYKDKCYKFVFYDYNDSGYDIVMNHNGFYICGTDGRHDDGNEIFSISSANPNSEWLGMSHSLITNYEFVYTGGQDFVNEFGDHKDIDKREVVLYNYDDIEESGEHLTEEWFFQQMTVQNIIPYQDFLKEFELIKSFYSSHVKKYDVINIQYLRDFDISLLEGFRVI